MLKITIDLISANGPDRNQIGEWTAILYNDGTGSKSRGNYILQIMKKGSKTQVWKAGTTSDFPRNELGPWDLLCRTLVDALGDRNVEAF